MKNGLPEFGKRDRVFDAVLVVICGIGQAAAAAVAAFATRDCFVALHAGDGVPMRPVVELASAGVMAALCLLLAQRRAEALGQSYANALRGCLYRRLAAMPKARHEQRRVGALSLRFVGDLSAARLWFGSGLPDVLTACVVLPGAVAILFSLDPRLAPVAMAPLAFALLLAGALARRLEIRHRALRTRRAGLAIAMIERIAMSPDLDLMGRTERELRALDERGQSLRRDAVARRGRTAALQAILHLGAAVAGLAVLWRAGEIGAAPGTVAASLSVLVLVTMPLRDLATAWDRRCAWRVARGKALALLSEPALDRAGSTGRAAVSIEVRGMLDGAPVSRRFEKGEVFHLDTHHGSRLARLVAGLDWSAGLIVTYDGVGKRPRTCFIADEHVGLQGSLRRTATLLNRRRPDDARIASSLRAFGLGHLLDGDRGLDRHVAEAGRGLSADESLRLDLVRAVLGEVGLLVIDSVRWRACADAAGLLALFASLSNATVLVVDTATVRGESNVTRDAAP